MWPAALALLTAAAPRPLHVVVANVGNLDEATGGPCPAAPYHGATCSVVQEAAVRRNLAALDPDIVVLLEVLDASLCASVPPSGDPDHACSGYAARTPYQQAERYVGAGYTILCDALAHYDCLAVRAGLIEVAECASGTLCIAGLDTPPQPEPCAGRGGLTSVSRAHLTVFGAAITLVVVHALPAFSPADDACRAAQWLQAFDQLADGPRNLVAGDFNSDPYRLPGRLFASADLWRSYVGRGRRFEALSAGDGPAPESWLGFGRYDHLLADFGFGACEVLGVTSGERLDAPHGTFDHRALDCWIAAP